MEVVMPRTIELSDSTHSRLVEMMDSDDTTENVVLRLLNFHKVHTRKDGGASPSSDAPDSGELHFKGAEQTDLTHAKVLKAQIDGLHLSNAKWNTILHHLAEKAFKNGAVDSSVAISGIVHGKKMDPSYKFLKKANISIRGQAANRAWSLSVGFANDLNVEVFVEFEWRNKKGAEYPGQKADLKNR